jgi:hypothetical protein
MSDQQTPHPQSSPKKSRRLLAIAIGAVIAILAVVLVLVLTHKSNPGTSANAGVASWAHKVVYANPSIILLQADIAQVTTADVSYSAICPAGVSVARTLQHGPYPPMATISATYSHYLSAAASMYQACVMAYASPTTAPAAAAKLVTQSKAVVLIGNQLNTEVQAQGGSLAPPVP